MAKNKGKENSLAGWAEAIRDSGRQMREDNQKIRTQLLARPHTIVEEQGCKIGLWHGEDCVLEATFRGDKKKSLDVHSIRKYSFDFVDALHKVRNQL